MCNGCRCYKEGNSGDGCGLVSTLGKYYELVKCELFVMS